MRRTTWWMRIGVVGAGVAASVLVLASTSSAVPVAEVTGDGPRGAALVVPGVATVSESRTESYQLPPDHPAAHWTALSVLGTEVIGSDAPHHAVPAEPSGLAADAGPAIEQVSEGLCPGEIDLGEGRSAELCAGLLESSVESFLNTPHATGSIASGTIGVADGTEAVGIDVTILPSSAEGLHPCGWAADAALGEVTLRLPGSVLGAPTEVPLLPAEERTCPG